MTQRETIRETTAPEVTIEARDGGGTRKVPANTPCVNAGPKYRALDTNGTIDAPRIDRTDLITLEATVIGSLVYVPDSSNGKVPHVFRLHRVAGGRPQRLPGAP